MARWLEAAKPLILLILGMVSVYALCSGAQVLRGSAGPRHCFVLRAFVLNAQPTPFWVQTLERRPYGNAILTKGVVGPDGNDLKP